MNPVNPVTHPLPLTSCPCCGAKLDAVNEVGGSGDAPRAGDVTVCFHCGEILIITEALGVRVPTAEEATGLLAADPALAGLQQKIRLFQSMVRAKRN